MARGIYVGVSILPTGYTPLEYIQSTGTQYINTYFYPEYTTRVVMDAQITTIGTTTQALFGARNASYQRAFAFMYSTVGPAFTSFFGSTTSQKFTTKDFTARLSINKNKSSCSLNSESMAHTSETFYSAYHLYLMASNEADTAKHFASMRLYSCQVYDNGTLVRNYIPCKNASGTVGLYDSVDQVFRANAGSGNFIAGPILTNRPGVARKVEKVYLGVNGIARKIARGYVGVDGIARSTFPSTVTWEKYDCNVITSPSYYREVEPYAGYHHLFFQNRSEVTGYQDYEFSSEDGYTGIDGYDYIMPNEISAILGLYDILRRTNVGIFESYIEEGDPDWPIDAPPGYPYMFFITPVAECERIDGGEDSYEQGDTYYGTIEVDAGELPEDGELVDGDVDGNYCVLCFPGDGYYYYERMTT